MAIRLPSSRRRRRAALLLGALWALSIHMLLLGSAAPLARHVTIHVAGWPSTTSPLRIVLLSDLHVAAPGDSPAHLRHVVAAVNRATPDLVLIAGDFLSTSTLLVARPSLAQTLAPLSGLRARLGTIAVLGNHDVDAMRRFRAAFPLVGVTMLNNQAVRRGPVTVIGVGDITTRRARPRPALEAGRRLGGFPIVLTHNPDLVPRLAPDIHLVLAGHTHCGQVAPWPIGPIVTESAYGRRYACGMVREGERLTIVGAGIGTSGLPIRLGAAPDYWIVDLGR